MKRGRQVNKTDNRESGTNPELSRSGKWKRTPSLYQIVQPVWTSRVKKSTVHTAREATVSRLDNHTIIRCPQVRRPAGMTI